MIRAVLFDLGDTLLLYHGLKLRTAFREGGVAAYDYLVEKGLTPPPFKRFWRAHFCRMIGRDIWCRLMRQEFCVVDVIRRVHRAYGIRLSDDEFVEVARRWYGPLGAYAHLEDGIHDTLERLETMGVKMAIVSNVPVPGLLVDEQLDSHDLMRFFPVRIYSSDFGERKPRRRLFTRALDDLNVSARESMFIGDRIYSDLQGAKRLGLTTILLPSRYTGWRPIKPDYSVNRVAELPGLIDKINSR